MSRPRILSLLPSTTEIVGGLGLSDQLVGLTHECDVCPDEAGMQQVLERGVERVTSSELNPHAMSQQAIDEAVKNSVSTGLSLYQLDEEAVRRARPTVVLTQALCSVCAPAFDEVQATCRRLEAALADEEGHEPSVLSIEPSTLGEVAESFVTVASACGETARGEDLRREFEDKLAQVRELTADASKPQVLLLEWLDPPFSGGHWVPEQITTAGGEPVAAQPGGKSVQLSWDAIEAADPDVVVVACCGFDLERNRKDAEALLSSSNQSEAARRFRDLRAVREGRLFALDGNRYFARPAPSLAEGTAILARVIHDGAPGGNGKGLDFLPAEGKAWARVGSAGAETQSSSENARSASWNARSAPQDGTSADWFSEHDRACARGASTYTDPESGYQVFTHLGLERRGTCCGCGCRHCPYGHENVQDKPGRIQQPAFLHRRGARRSHDAPRHVLFWSGGKDSLLALRAWLRATTTRTTETHAAEALDCLVLMTTFDAASRRVAHQEVSIADIQRQAEALDLDLVGVPLHPGTEYLERIERGLQRVAADGNTIESLVFGDLHLAHIKEWRDGALARFGYRLEYPLWQVDQSLLMDDLLSSAVPCVISACPKTDDAGAPPDITVGRHYDRTTAELARTAGWDAFGEHGEFHTLAQVWEVPAERALGIAEC